MKTNFTKMSEAHKQYAKRVYDSGEKAANELFGYGLLMHQQIYDRGWTPVELGQAIEKFDDAINTISRLINKDEMDIREMLEEA